MPYVGLRGTTNKKIAGPRGAVGTASDSSAELPGSIPGPSHTFVTPFGDSRRELSVSVESM